MALTFGCISPTVASVKPFDIQTIEKLYAAIQQVEAAIELFYAKRYAPAITLAAAAEGCAAAASAAIR